MSHTKTSCGVTTKDDNVLPGNCLPAFLTTFLPPSLGWRHALKDPDDTIFSCHHRLPSLSLVIPLCRLSITSVAICCLMPALWSVVSRYILCVVSYTWS